MTPVDMPAGAEMDRLIAERVMGWTPTAFLRSWESRDQWSQRPMAEVTRATMSGESVVEMWGGTSYDVEDWRPSTDLVCAWEVVEHLVALRQTLRVYSSHSDDGVWFAVDAPNPAQTWRGGEIWRTSWAAGFRDAHDCEGQGWAMGFPLYAPTAPLAICRAALTACPPGAA